MTTTTELREWWAPVCTGPFVKVALHGQGLVSVRSEVVDAVHALNACLAAHDYETRAADTGAFNCRQITGGTNWSLHAYGIALDINWSTNPYGPNLVTDMPAEMVAAIKAVRTRNGKQVWRWGGDYSGNKDAMHFEITCHPADLETGLDPSTIPNLEEDELDKNQAEQLGQAAVAAVGAFERIAALTDNDNRGLRKIIRQEVAGRLDPKRLADRIARRIPDADAKVIAEEVVDELVEALSGGED